MNVRDELDLLPLRQTVSASGEAESFFARRGLLQWLSRPGKYRIVGHGSGGQILAGSEIALADAQLVLRQAYGPLVAFGETTVHTYVDLREEVLMVPLMFMRIDAPRAHAAQLQDILEERGAALQEIDRQRDRVVMRAEVQLTRALGLHRELSERTDGAAHVLCWLIGYERAMADATE